MDMLLEEKILIVDDNPHMSSLLNDVLDMLGYQGSCVADGEEALEILKGQKFALVITDFCMPRMDGGELLAKIRQEYPSLPVVVITGYSKEALSDPDKLKGVDGFLIKPFKVKEIEDVLQKLVP